MTINEWKLLVQKKKRDWEISSIKWAKVFRPIRRNWSTPNPAPCGLFSQFVIFNQPMRSERDYIRRYPVQLVFSGNLLN